MMQHNSHLSARLYLTLSLAIASSLVTRISPAAATEIDRSEVTKLSQTIANLIDLDVDRQNLITLAINRAIASKETSPVPHPVLAGVPAPPKVETPPVIRGRMPKPQPSPTPDVDGMKIKPTVKENINRPQIDR
jgi:hypothetical protein